MNWNVVIANGLTGGFLKGKRTTILAVVALAGLIGNYLTGDADLVTFLQHSWEQIAMIFGLVTAAASGNTPTDTAK